MKNCPGSGSTGARKLAESGFVLCRVSPAGSTNGGKSSRRLLHVASGKLWALSFVGVVQSLCRTVSCSRIHRSWMEGYSQPRQPFAGVNFIPQSGIYEFGCWIAVVRPGSATIRRKLATIVVPSCFVFTYIVPTLPFILLILYISFTALENSGTDGRSVESTVVPHNYKMKQTPHRNNFSDSRSKAIVWFCISKHFYHVHKLPCLSAWTYTVLH